jgi:DNA-binding response OmpR family regulator
MTQTAVPLPALTFGPFLLDEGNARLTRDGEPIEIPPKPFAVLCHLVRNAPRLVTKDELLDAVWGHRHVSESVLKTAVNQLRTQLCDDSKEPCYIETASRRGYRFIAPLAAASASGSAASPKASQPKETSGSSQPSILAVDDEAEVLSLLEDYLGARGFQVTTAANTQEARSILGSQKIDLVLLDITMPGEDGLSLARHLREHHGPPVIMLTALDTLLDRIVGLEVGADDYVAKPFDLRELLARIKSVLRRAGG